MGIEPHQPRHRAYLHFLRLDAVSAIHLPGIRLDITPAVYLHFFWVESVLTGKRSAQFAARRTKARQDGVLIRS